MKLRVLWTGKWAVLAGLCVFASVGCSGGYPVSVEVSIPVISGYTVEDYGDANPGDILTPDTDIPPVPICTMPDSEEVDEMVRDAVGGFVAGFFDVERLELLDIKIEAVENDFNTLTALSMFYESKPVLGVAQPAVDLGEAGSETGLGTTITLEPPQPVDFLELIEDNESNPWPDCPTLDVQMTGTVPAMSPRWDVSVRLRMEGHISL